MKTTYNYKHYTSPITVVVPLTTGIVLQNISGLNGLQDGGQATPGIIPQ